MKNKTSNKENRLLASLFSLKLILRIFAFFKKKEKNKTILLINYNNLGDIICDTPSLRNIRKAYQEERVILLVRNQGCIELMKKCPYIDMAIEMPHSRDSLKEYFSFCKKLLKYDFIFSMQFVRPFFEIKRSHIAYLLGIKERYGLIQNGFEEYYRKTFTHCFYLKNNTTRTEESLELLRLKKIPIDSEETECWIDHSNVQMHYEQRYIVIQTCATMLGRMWHNVLFTELIDRFCEEYNASILLTGTQEEFAYISNIRNNCHYKEKIEIVCNINIDTLLELISKAELMVTNDTGPFHFARALDTPLVALFGISPPEYLLREETKQCKILRGRATCNKSCRIGIDSRYECKKIYKMFGDEYHCINNISAEDVMRKINELIHQNSNINISSRSKV